MSPFASIIEDNQFPPVRRVVLAVQIEGGRAHHLRATIRGAQARDKWSFIRQGTPPDSGPIFREGIHWIATKPVPRESSHRWCQMGGICDANGQWWPVQLSTVGA